MIHEIKTLNPSIHNLKLVCLIKRVLFSIVEFGVKTLGTYTENFIPRYVKL
jgi:hypothetical protein